MAANGAKLGEDLTLAELLDTDFVVCENCGAIFTSPLLLPCLHTLCQKCVMKIIAKENIDKLTGKERKNSPSNQHLENPDEINNAVHEQLNTKTNDHYIFSCPICKSQITIENGCYLDSTRSNEQEDQIIADDKVQNGPTEMDDSYTADDRNNESSPVLSLTIPATKYQDLQKAITHNLPGNFFIESMARLYKYRNDVGRECAYCKTEDVVEMATCLCLQCGDDVCDGCAGAHRKTRITRDHSVVTYAAIQQGLFDHDIRKARGILCSEHPESDVTHFCNDCLKIVCKNCRSKRHHNHNTHPLEEAASKWSQDISNVQEGLARRLPDLSKYIEFLSQQLQSLQQRHRDAEQNINAQVQRIHDMVNDWKEKTVSNLNAAVDQERKAIQDKIETFKVSKKSTEKSASFLYHLHNLGKADEKMGSYSTIMRRYRQLLRAKPKAMTSRLGISFTPGPTTDQNIRILIGQLGLKKEELHDKDTPKNRLPIKTLMPALLESPVLRKSWNITRSPSTSQTKCSSDQHTPPHGLSSCYISGIDIKGNLLAAVDRDNAKVIIVDYSSQKVLKEFTGTGAHKLRKPFDVAFLPSGALAITDTEASGVRVFDWTGNYLFNFEDVDKSHVRTARNARKQKQEGDGEQSAIVRHPRGITVTKTGEVVVVDGHLKHCTVHDSNTGKILWTIHPHKENFQKCGVQENGVETNVTNHNLLNGDSTTGGMQKSFKSQTDLLDVILVDPFYICTTQDNNLVITDAASPNVKILGWPRGELLQESLDYGIRQEECLHPAGVYADQRSGYILLVDTINNRIHLGLPDGHFSTILIPPQLSESSTSTINAVDTNRNQKTGNSQRNTNSKDVLLNNGGQLSHPTCLCLDPDGQIVVAQVGGNINVYQYL